MVASGTEVLRPLRRVEYDKLVDLGVFDNERVELLDGALVAMSPIGEPHNAALSKLTELFVLTLHGRAWVRVQMSFAALEHSEPEPDLSLVPREEYSPQKPSQAHLIVEVAESSLAYDRVRKLRVYASCGVPEYWIVNIPERCIEVYRDAQGESYARVETYQPGQSIRIAAFSDVEIRVSDVL